MGSYPISGTFPPVKPRRRHTIQMSVLSEDELREQITRAFDHYYRDDYEGDWYISNGDSFHGTIDDLMRLVRLYVTQEAEAHADANLASIKPPTMSDVFPEKPYDGSKAHSDMVQVVRYYEKAIVEQRERNAYPIKEEK